MIKHFVLAATLAASALGASAQIDTLAIDNRLFSKTSPDGNWLIEDNNGTLTMYDRANDKLYEYVDELADYTFGMGSLPVSNEGVMVGSNGSNPVLMQGGEMTMLPVISQDKSDMSLANSMTEDGKYIIGFLGVGTEFGSDGLMVCPVLWTRSDNGEYVCEKLPYPEKDFLGQTPQMVTAVDISSDGRTAVGQVMSGNGFYTCPILYTKGADGKWSYEILAEDAVYDASRLNELPELPVAPIEPKVRDYMSDDDIYKYQEALNYYNEQYELANQGIIDWADVPPYPKEVNFISDAAKKAEYDNAKAQYDIDDEQYWTDYAAYDEAMRNITTGASFIYNCIMLSRNGRYLISALQEPDPDSPSPEFGADLCHPVLIDLHSADRVLQMPEDANKHIAASVSNAGEVMIATPAMEYTRSAAVFKAGEKKSVPFVDYLKSRGLDDAVKFMNNNLLYDVTVVNYDPEGNPIPEIVTDSLITGSVSCNADATVFVSFFYDMYTELNAFRTYFIDLNTGIASGIHEAVKPEDVEGEIVAREYYNLQGQRIAAPIKGIYLEKEITTKGVRTYKRVQ